MKDYKDKIYDGNIQKQVEWSIPNYVKKETKNTNKKEKNKKNK